MKTFLQILFFFLLVTQICFAQWVRTNGTYGYNVNAFAVSGTNLFAGAADTSGGGVFLSTNNGTSWTEVNTGLTNTMVGAFAVIGTNLFAGTTGGVFLSTNNGTSWTEVNTGLTDTWVFAFAVSGTNLFAGTYSSVFLSTNNGTSWTAVNTGLYNTVQAFAVSGTNLFAGTYNNGVWLSTNNGTSWTSANTGLHETVQAMAVSGTNLFVGVFYGVFLSTNNGTSWTAVGTGLLNVDVHAFAVSGTYLFAGMWNEGGVWRRPLSEMITDVEEVEQLPNYFALGQNYPNPFNPSTKIKYAIPEIGFITIKIYDVLGNEIATLVNEEKIMGSYEVEFGARTLPSGIYFYRLQAGSFVETKKMVLLR